MYSKQQDTDVGCTLDQFHGQGRLAKVLPARRNYRTSDDLSVLIESTGLLEQSQNQMEFH
jgi:hypothetical protein